MDASDRSGRPPDGRRTSKVARLVDEYELDGLGAELEHRWTTDGDEHMSLRELADYFNRRLLAAAMEEAGIGVLDGEVENLYRLLTADGISGGDRARARRQLEREGIDTDDLQSAFVSYQAIRTYLVEYRGAEYERDDRNRVERDARSIRQLRGRLESVTESKLERLRDADHVDVGEFRTLVTVNVFCEDCGTQLDVDDLLEGGACGCGGS